jgi:type II secretory pathway component PulJ
MHMNRPTDRGYRASRARQSGAVLIVSLLLLMAVTVLSSTAVSTSIMELRMSNNTESNVNTFQTAMAAVDFVLSDSSNLPTSGPLNVPVAVTLAGTPFDTSTGEVITASVSRVEDCGPPPRMRNATSMIAYSSFSYRVTADVNKNSSGMGQAGMVQGYLLFGPKC